ncbi:MAG: hypothetical protein ACE1ZS_08870 [Candidatus Poribacteria bacterium]
MDGNNREEDIGVLLHNLHDIFIWHMESGSRLIYFPLFIVEIIECHNPKLSMLGNVLDEVFETGKVLRIGLGHIGDSRGTLIDFKLDVMDESTKRCLPPFVHKGPIQFGIHP